MICGAKPIRDPHNKWYSPQYMFQGKVYPMYLSGTGRSFLKLAEKCRQFIAGRSSDSSVFNFRLCNVWKCGWHAV